MRDLIFTAAEAAALALFLAFIGLVALPALPLARPAAASPTRLAGCAEPPAPVLIPRRAGRDLLAELIGRRQ